MTDRLFAIDNVDVDGGNLSACLVEVGSLMLGHLNKIAWPVKIVLYHPHA